MYIGESCISSQTRRGRSNRVTLIQIGQMSNSIQRWCGLELCCSLHKVSRERTTYISANQHNSTCISMYVARPSTHVKCMSSTLVTEHVRECWLAHNECMCQCVYEVVDVTCEGKIDSTNVMSFFSLQNRALVERFLACIILYLRLYWNLLVRNFK